MRALTPSERRGALMVVLLFALGTGWDALRARFPVVREWVGDPGAPSPGSQALPPSDARAGDPAPVVPAREPLDLNQADAQALDDLPGIGPVMARRIVQYRRQYGPFRETSDLRAVRGIGPRLYARIAPLVRVRTARSRVANGADSAQVMLPAAR
jgi:competence ComEA-like helix-hairpin-helix protein